MMKKKRLMIPLFMILLLAMLAGPAFMLSSGKVPYGNGWRNAPTVYSGEALNPAQIREAVVQVYSARAVSWRGAFAVHTWIAVKPENAADYTTYEVTRWSGLRTRKGRPDTSWFGNTSELLFTLRGNDAQRTIEDIKKLAAAYPYAKPDQYRAWPGPNSNTFVAWMLRRTPQLAVSLPSNALGKDYLGTHVLAATPSDTGYQFSAWGVFGLTVARREGLEVNLFGLVFGFDPSPSVKWPGIGDIGGHA